MLCQSSSWAAKPTRFYAKTDVKKDRPWGEGVVGYRKDGVGYRGVRAREGGARGNMKNTIPHLMLCLGINHKSPH